jgi:putative ABC transport system permease protein
MRRLVRRLRSFLSRGRLAREIEQELRNHVELEAEELCARGLDERAARRAASVAFGSADTVAEQIRDVRGFPRVDVVLRELHHAARALARSPGFTCAAVGVLGLGIGAATAAYGIARAVVLRPLPYAEEARLFSVYESDSTGALRVPSFPAVRDWRAGTRTFEALAYVRGETLGVRDEDGTRLLLGAFSSAELFRALDVQPALGRVFGAAEAEQGEPVVVLAWHLWRDQFGSDPHMVGRMLSTELGPLTVIGVMPEGVRYPSFADVWLPVGALTRDGRRAVERRDLHVDAQTVGRIAATATQEQAAAELSAFAAEAATVHPDARGWTSVSLRSVRSEVLADAPGRLALLGGATVLLLLVACVSVAGLLVARAVARGRELSVRAALGATPRRLAGQLLAESALLATLGGILGVLVAAASMRILIAYAPTALPRLDGAGLGGGALAFAIAISAFTAMLSGLLPARRAGRAAPMDVLRSARGTSSGRGEERVRRILVVAEVALAAMLVVGATSLSRTLLRLGATDPGFDTAGIATVRVTPPMPRYASPEAALALFARLQEEVGKTPDVQQVALVNHLPLSGTAMVTSLRTSRTPDAEDRPFAFYRAISANFFDTLDIDLVRGRALTEAEVQGHAPVVVVNESLATREWPDRDPIGESITIRKVAQGRADFGEEITLTVVGVVSDTRSFGPTRPEGSVVYAPYTLVVWGNTFVVAKGRAPTRRLVDGLRNAVQRVDPAIPVLGPGFSQRVRAYDEYAASFLAAPRLSASVLGSFAGASLLLATVGLFGVIAYLVVQRRREFGVRVAMGATGASIVRLVLREASILVVIGIAIGFVGAYLLGRKSTLGELDYVTFAVSSIVFLVAALTASVLPAIRAARLAPARILRE